MQKSKCRKILCLICIILILTITCHVTGEKTFNDTYDTHTFSDKIDWWTMRHHDQQNSGYSKSTAPNSNNIIWNHDFPGSLHYTPLVWKNIVYINRYGSEAPLYCLNATNGNVQWKYSIPGSWNAGQTPAIDEGLLYISFLYYRPEYKSQEFLCLNATNGCRIWSYNFTDFIISCASSPAAADGYVYFGSNNNSLFCFDANPYDDNIDEGIDDPDESTYDLVWLFNTGGDIQHTPAIDDGRIYVVSRRCAGGDLFCLNAYTGEEIWHDYCGDITTSTVVYNGRIYYGAIGGAACDELYTGRVVCIDTDNPSHRYWEYEIPTYVVYAAPAVAYDKVFVGNDNGCFFCLDAYDGTLIWETQTTCRWMGSTPAVADNKLYTISGQNVVCLSCNDGEILWTHPVKRVDVPYKYTSPAIANGKVYVGVVEKSSFESCIYAFEDGIGIQDIKSGRRGPKVIIQNTGDIDLNVNVMITFEHISGLIFAGLEIPVSIGGLRPGETHTLKRMAIGFGRIRVIASADAPQKGYGSTKTVQALILGLNTIILPELF